MHKNLLKSARMYFLLIQRYTADFQISEELKQQFASTQKQLDDGNFDSKNIDHTLLALIEELDQHMLIWHLHKVRTANFVAGLDSPIAYLLASPNVATCIQDFQLTNKLLFRQSLRLEVSESEHHITLHFSDDDDPIDAYGLKSEILMLYVQFVLKQLIGNHFSFERINFPDTRIGLDKALVESYSGAIVQQSGHRLFAQIAKYYLSIENAFYDAELRARLKNEIVQALEKISSAKKTSQQIATWLSQSDAPAAISFDMIAKQLNKGQSTLRRLLSNEDTSFRQIQNQVVAERAIELLSNSDEKVDVIASLTGYNDRNAFERFFRGRFFKSPSQFRKLANKLTFLDSSGKLQQVIQTLPPLAESCEALINASKQDMLTVDLAVTIVSKDPIFSARAIGYANRAIYARPPKDLRDAIATNIGLSKLVDMAIMFAAVDSFAADTSIELEPLIRCMMIIPDLLMRAFTTGDAELSNEDAQALMYVPLGIAVLAHQKLSDASQLQALIDDCPNLFSLSLRLNEQFGLSYITTSQMMLTNWNIPTATLKVLAALDEGSGVAGMNAQKRIQMLIVLNIAWAVCFQKPDSKAIIEKIAQSKNIALADDVWSLAENLANSVTKKPFRQ